MTLDELRIGDIRLRHVDAVINTWMRGPSLLGMSFLGRLGGFRVERGEPPSPTDVHRLARARRSPKR